MNTWRYISERFPLKVTLPLSAILAFGPMSRVSFTLAEGVTVYITIFVTLLTVRIADDLTSIDIDRITHPERGLPSGKIHATTLNYVMAVLVIMVVLLNLLSGNVKGMLFIAAYYTFFFCCLKLISLLLKPLFSNFVFCWIPVYIADSLVGQVSFEYVALGLFTYVSVIAHEYAHSVHAENESKDNVKTYSLLLGSWQSAMLSLLVYVAAGFLGYIYWFYADRPLLFLLILMVTSVQIILLGIRLIKDPSSRTAQPFYFKGFGFFLYPYLGLILDNIFRGKVILWQG